MIDDDEPLDELRNLPREMAPPERLERSIAVQLRPRRRAWLPYAAAFVVMLAAGYIALQPHAGNARATHILLLFDVDLAKPNPDLAREYGAWAPRTPQIVGGEELGAPVAAINDHLAAAAAQSHLGGYFLIAATSDAEAKRVAEACPHLRHGGTIVVRRIEQR